MKEKIAIVGFGLSGRVAAMMLCEHYQVEVFESAHPNANQGIGHMAAAMLAPMAESVHCDQHIVESGLHAIKLWPQLLAMLDEPVFFQQQGSVIVSHPQDSGTMAQFSKLLKPLNGLNAQQLDQSSLAQLEPELASRFNSGLYLPCEAQLDNQAFYQHCASYLHQRGVHFHIGVEASVDVLAEQTYKAVIDCRGLGAKSDIKELRGVRGEVARVYAPDVHLTRPVRLMHPRYPVYIVPKPDDIYVIGATEIESQSTCNVTVRSSLELLSAAFSVHSGFAEAHIQSLKAGLRPALDDNRPRVEHEGKVIRINGLYRHGYMLAPVLVKEALSEFNTAI